MSTIHPSSLGDLSSALLKQSFSLEPEKSTCTSPRRSYAAILLTLTIVEDSKQVRTRRRRRNNNQRRQIIKDGWADYEGVVVRYEDIQFEQNYPEETVAPSQVWREKITIHEQEAPPEALTTPSNESQDD